jgi:hypothetical protein
LKKIDIHNSSYLFIIQTQDNQFIGTAYCVECYFNGNHFSLSKGVAYGESISQMPYGISKNDADVFLGDIGLKIINGICNYRTDSRFSDIPNGKVKSIEIFTWGKIGILSREMQTDFKREFILPLEVPLHYLSL